MGKQRPKGEITLNSVALICVCGILQTDLNLIGLYQSGSASAARASCQRKVVIINRVCLN